MLFAAVLFPTKVLSVTTNSRHVHICPLQLIFFLYMIYKTNINQKWEED